MQLHTRLAKLERDQQRGTPDGRRRCPVCADGAKLASVARFEDYPDWGDRGASVCHACGRECAAPVVVRGINPDLL